MHTATYCAKQVIPRAFADVAVVNLSLFLGLVARYAVLVGLNAAPNLIWGFTTATDLWRSSTQAFLSAAPWLTALALVVFTVSGFYRSEHAYRDRKAIAIVIAASVVFPIFALVSYLSTVLGYLLRQSDFMPFPRSAFFAAWLLTIGLMLAARQGAQLWASAREGRLLGQVIRNRYFFVADLIWLTLAAWLSFVARLDPAGLDGYYLQFLVYLGSCLAVKPLVYYWAGLYRRYWRYASIGELATIVGANLAATLGVIVLAYLLLPIFYTFDQVPRSIPLIDFLLTTACIGGTRFLVRLLGDRRFAHWLERDPVARPSPAQRVLIAGAGDAGAMIVKEMQANPHLGLEPVVFIDADPRKRGAQIHGVPVLGDRRQIHAAVAAYQLQQAIIAMPTASGKAIRELVSICEQAKLPVRIVPGIYEILDGRVTVNQLRTVQIEDLLRREPVQVDSTAVQALVAGRRVLVTGAGGSIGSELCRQLARCNPAELILLGHGENSIFQFSAELARTYPALRFVKLIADVRDSHRLTRILAHSRPEIVFHAAAHKHVPLMEENIEDAISNNILGTRNVVEAATAAAVQHLVLISSDKAVNPSSVMGATKRVAELIVSQAAAHSVRNYVSVRFGNVLGSRGSVVNTFREQIAQGGPLTITDPEMRRYFMTIPEAVQLVLQAATLGKGGECFVLEMGEPIKIVDLARDLIKLSGLQEGRDIDIVFTGARPGEKLFEELFVTSETYAPTAHAKILVARNADGAYPATKTQRPLFTEQSPISVAGSSLDQQVAELIDAAQRGAVLEIRRLLQNIVPEYQPSDSALETFPTLPRIAATLSSAADPSATITRRRDA